MPKEKTYIVVVTSVDYCVEEEDVCDLVNVKPQYTTAWYDAIDTKIEEIKKGLPQTFTFEITCEKQDLKDLVIDKVTNETCWLINSLTFTSKVKKVTK